MDDAPAVRAGLGINPPGGAQRHLQNPVFTKIFPSGKARTRSAHGFSAADDLLRPSLDEAVGFRPDYIEHKLAHAVRDRLRRAYSRTAHLPERKKILQRWADYLDGLSANSNVMPMVRKAV